MSNTVTDTTKTPSQQRKIIHCDCDCFYAAIEMRDNPSLKGKAIAVGGSPGKRGVVATCNYEARKFGIHSAMASATAIRLCPQLIIIPPNMEKYRKASQAIHEVFHEYTDIIEPLSLDEAYLDVSDIEACQGSATLMADEIRKKVEQRLNITISAGVAPNKFLAKIASDWNKPNGTFVITPNQVDDFVKVLPVKKLLGVGKVTSKKMHRFGINTCGDLRKYNVFELSKKFGSFGERLSQLAQGYDVRPVNTSRRRKSLSVEHTYDTDLTNIDDCLNALNTLYPKFLKRLNEKIDQDYMVVKVFVKVKFSDFTSTTMEQAADKPTIEGFKEICKTAFERQQLSVRLLGIGVQFHDLQEEKDINQLELFDRQQLL